jgi:hypothetical protein
MIVQYQYVTWSPPSLTDEEELEYGRQIALVGREHFVREFRKSILGSQQPKEGGISSWHPAARWAFTAAFVSLMLFGLTLMNERQWSGMIMLMIMALAIYFVSAYFAARKYEKWIDHLVARYAAHVARGGL